MAFDLGSIVNKGLSLGAMMQALSGVSPEMRRFIGGAFTAGYGAKNIIEFLRDQVGGKSHLSRNRHMRPDEEAALARQESDQLPLDVATNLASGAIGLGGGALARGLGAAASALGTTLPQSGASGAGPAATQSGASPQLPTPSAPAPLPVPAKGLKAQVQADIAKQQAPSPTTMIHDPLEGLKQAHPQLAKFVENQALKGNTADMIAKQARSIRALSGEVQKVEEKAGVDFALVLDQLLGNARRSAEQASEKIAQGAAMSDQELIDRMQQILKM